MADGTDHARSSLATAGTKSSKTGNGFIIFFLCLNGSVDGRLNFLLNVVKCKALESAGRLLRSLDVLTKMAANGECLHMILIPLTEHVGILVRALQEANNSSDCHAQVSTLLHNLLQVI